MARGLGTTLGVGTNDVISVANYTAINDLTTFTFAIWFNRRATGNAFPRIINKTTGLGNGLGVIFAYTDGSSIEFDADRWATAQGRWTIDHPSVGDWHQLTLTYDYGSTSNDPVFYIDGSSVTITAELGTPSGSLNSETQTCLLGNRADGTRGWDGMLAEAALWNVVLTASQAAAIGKGVSPLAYPTGLVGYWPLMGRYSPEINLVAGNTGSLTGTAVQPHPRVLYPAPVLTFGKPTRRNFLPLLGVA